jgi:hypothetical protein
MIFGGVETTLKRPIVDGSDDIEKMVSSFW